MEKGKSKMVRGKSEMWKRKFMNDEGESEIRRGKYEMGEEKI